LVVAAAFESEWLSVLDYSYSAFSFATFRTNEKGGEQGEAPLLGDSLEIFSQSRVYGTEFSDFFDVFAFVELLEQRAERCPNRREKGRVTEGGGRRHTFHTGSSFR
jgi:hypothetical protein